MRLGNRSRGMPRRLRTTGWLLFLAASCGTVTGAPPVESPPEELLVTDLIASTSDESTLAHIVVFLTHDCPIANQYSPELRRIAEDHPRFPMLVVHVDPDATAAELEQHRQDYGLPGTVFHDADHRLVAELDARATPEAFLLEQDGRVAYRGRIDDLYPSLGTKRRSPRTRDLRDAIEALERGERPETAETEAIGCRIPELPR